MKLTAVLAFVSIAFIACGAHATDKKDDHCKKYKCESHQPVKPVKPVKDPAQVTVVNNVYVQQINNNQQQVDQQSTQITAVGVQVEQTQAQLQQTNNAVSNTNVALAAAVQEQNSVNVNQNSLNAKQEQVNVQQTAVNVKQQATNVAVQQQVTTVEQIANTATTVNQQQNVTLGQHADAINATASRQAATDAYARDMDSRLGGRLDSQQSQISSLKNDVRQAKEGASAALAVAGQQFCTGQECGFQVALSAATMNGSQAIALGMGGAVSENVFINAALTKSGSTTGAVVSGTYRFK